MNIFNKVKSGASNFFQKVGQNANNIYKKVSSGINDFNNNVVSKGIDIARKVSNNLERYAPSISEGAAGIATATGFGSLAPGILMAGQNLAQLGSRLGNATENFSTRRNAIQSHVNNLQNKISGNLPAATYERINKGTVFP